MEVGGVRIPDKALTNFELLNYANKLKIPNFRGIYMRDNLPAFPNPTECGIVNLNTSAELGSHWICYYKNKEERIYFDSFGMPALYEVQKYLKKPHLISELLIQRNTEIVQSDNSKICGHLCLFVLKGLTDGKSFRHILNSLSISGSGKINWTNSLADELHKPVKHNFPKRYVFVRKAKNIWGIDIVDMSKLSRQNNGYKYILMIIDIFSKFGRAEALKTKTGLEVSKVLGRIFKTEKPKKIWVDRGGEFYNKNLEIILKEENIEIYSTENDEKCSVVERWNRTIKTQLWKYFTANGTHNWVQVLQPLIDKYNSTKHRATGFTPSDARKPSNRTQVFQNLYRGKVKGKLAVPKFKVGERVRIAIQKNLFEKAYIINWSDRIYKIKKIQKTRPRTYIVVDLNGKQHKGSFYTEDLQKNKDERFRIQKVLKYKTINGKRYGLVKWIGYDRSESTWEPEEEIKGM